MAITFSTDEARAERLNRRLARIAGLDRSLAVLGLGFFVPLIHAALARHQPQRTSAGRSAFRSHRSCCCCCSGHSSRPWFKRRSERCRARPRSGNRLWC